MGGAAYTRENYTWCDLITDREEEPIHSLPQFRMPPAYGDAGGSWRALEKIAVGGSVRLAIKCMYEARAPIGKTENL